MLMKKNLLTLGCSHSHTAWGKSWPDFLSEQLDCNLIRGSSPGAGNGFFIEKMHHAVKNMEIDLAVIQLTDPTRVVLGFKNNENLNGGNIELSSSGTVGDLGCYTWNCMDNETNLKRMLGKSVSIDHIWFEQITYSKWIDYKVMQDIIVMKYLCDEFKIPCVFWSWFVPMEELFIPQYSWLSSKIKKVNGCARNHIMKNNIKCLDDGHYDTQAQERLFNGWLWPNIRELL